MEEYYKQKFKKQRVIVDVSPIICLKRREKTMAIRTIRTEGDEILRKKSKS